MSFSGFDLSKLSKAHDRVGHHLGCVLGLHDFNRRRICRKCKFVDAMSEDLKKQGI